MAPKKKKTASKKKSAVVKQKNNLPATMDFEGDAGAGMENVDQDSVAIPYMKLLQSNSPQCEEDDDLYMKGAKPGMFFHTVNENLYEHLFIIPCHFERVFNEWVHRDAGGGFKGRFEIPEFLSIKTERDDTGKFWRIGGENTYFMDTRNHFCLLLNDDGEAEPVIISLSSTQLKVSRKWMSLQKGIKLPKSNNKGTFTPPCYAHIYEVTSYSDQNAKGKFKGWKFSMVRMLEKNDEVLYAQAKEFDRLISEGKAKAADPAERVDEDLDEDPEM